MHIKLMIFPMLFAMMACNGGPKQKPATEAVAPVNKWDNTPVFNSDSAYHFVKMQLDFGPRVPNSDAQKACANFLEEKLKSYGASVITQKLNLKRFDGLKLEGYNIIGSFFPEKEHRILFLTHWDSRYISDMEKDPALRAKPVPAANDGASGTAVLLELARQLSLKSADIGVDIFFNDLEDQGPPNDIANNYPKGDWWCLGAQYWARNPHKNGYNARYAILLDMVGAPGAQFYREEVSMQFAPGVVEQVWKIANESGFGSWFNYETIGGITDDHVYVNYIARIPCIDIIHLDKNSPHLFGHYWHTQKDDLPVVDKATLKAVGQTLTNLVYTEK